MRMIVANKKRIASVFAGFRLSGADWSGSTLGMTGKSWLGKSRGGPVLVRNLEIGANQKFPF
jgi:hypothetical protein